MFDSLNRHYLSPYNEAVSNTPNFERFARKCQTFETSYVSSMPCIPARRDFLTGRYSFLHRSWGPLEPFDITLPDQLRKEGVYSHLATDHQHYFEDGGANYHCRYDSWEFSRGQEGDKWHGCVGEVPRPDNVSPAHQDRDQDWKNRSIITQASDMPIAKTFAAGLEFMERNKNEDNWFLQIETFDPHEPFFTLDEHKTARRDHYDHYDGPVFDWPPYRKVEESEALVAHARAEYASLVGLCDSKLGEVLDLMDRNQMWEDTMLVVWTDHGFLLGEHDSWAKVWTPFYEEVARTPFFVWDPRSPRQGMKRSALVQPAVDLAPTLLGFFGAEVPEANQGKDLSGTLSEGLTVRDVAVFGVHGMQVNLTDGQYVYMREPDLESPIFEYTLMPAHMNEPFSVADLGEQMTLADPFPFSRGCCTLKIEAKLSPYKFDLTELDLDTRYYDLDTDPGQEKALSGDMKEGELSKILERELRDLGAPPELFKRLKFS